MALGIGEVVAQPDQACLGTVKSVGNTRASATEGSPYYVTDIEIVGEEGAKNAKYFLVYEPRWFAPDFDVKQLLQEGEAGGKKYQTFRKNIADKKRTGALQALAGVADSTGEPNYPSLFAAFDELAEEPTPEEIEEILRERLVGQSVGYVLKQDTDESGELMDRMTVSYFFFANTDGVEAITKSAGNAKRRSPLILTWDE